MAGWVRRRRATLLAPALVAVACADLLGIQERERQPMGAADGAAGTGAAAADATPGAGGTVQSGGSAGMAGSAEFRSECRALHGDDPCWTCICGACPLDTVRTCVESPACGALADCVRMHCCPNDPAACGGNCQDPDGVATDEMTSCLWDHCPECGSTGCGTGGSGGAGIGGVGGVGGVGGGAIETCNFRDDDGDGDVDEGFEWFADPPNLLFDAQGLFRSAPTAEGGVAVAAFEGGASVRGVVTSATYSGHSVLAATLPSGTAAGVAVTGNSRQYGAAAAWVSAPPGGCDVVGGCPVVFVETDLRDDSGRLEATFGENFFGARPDALIDLAWTGTSYVIGVRAVDGTVRVVWFQWDGVAFSKLTAQQLPHPGDGWAVPLNSFGSFATGPPGVLWAGAGPGPELRLRRFSIDGATSTRIDYPDVAGRMPARKRAVVWLGQDPIVMYGQPPLAMNGEVVRLGADGSPKAGPTPLGGCTPWDIATVGETLVIPCAEPGGLVRVLRLRSNLDLMPDAVVLPAGIDGQTVYTLTQKSAGGPGLVLGLRDSTSVRTAVIHCQ